MPTPKKPTAHPNAATAIAAAQANMSNAVKDSTNPHFKQQYASLAAVRDIVVPAFAAEGVGVLQPIEGENGAARVRTLLLWGDQVIEAGNCSIPIGGGRNAAQDVGAIATYLRRYQLAAVGGISQEDDDAESVQPPRPRSPQNGAQGVPPDNRGQTPPQRRQAAPAGYGGRGGGISWARTPCPRCGAKVYDNRGDDGPTLFKCADGQKCPGGKGRFGWAEFDDPEWDNKQQAKNAADANDANGAQSANADPMSADDRPPPHEEDPIPF